jgi:single-strand DNA-binding protein
MNQINLIGRITADAETKNTQTGKTKANFTLAVQRTKDEADFILCEAWEKTAELISQHTKKGDRIGITGSLRVEKYEKDGEKKTFTKVLINSMYFLSEKKEEKQETVSQHLKNKNPKTEKEIEEEFPF